MTRAQKIVLDKLAEELQQRIQERLVHLALTNIVGQPNIRVELDELGVTVTAIISEDNNLSQLHYLHLKFRKAIAAEFKSFLDAGGKMPNLSIVFVR